MLLIIHIHIIECSTLRLINCLESLRGVNQRVLIRALGCLDEKVKK